LRVLGQILVAFLEVQWLPPMERWYSGLVPYPALLASQLLIIALMVTICVQFTRGGGWFYEPRRILGFPLLLFGWTYLAVMLGRAVLIWDRPIPIVFHGVLAAFIIVVASWHRR
jgi:uncharacterized protein